MAVRFLLLVPLMLALLAACADAPQDKITGERVPVLSPAARLAAPTAEAAAALLVVPAAETVADWPQVMGRPDMAQPHSTLAAKLREAWDASIGGGDKRTKLLARPIAANDLVFTLDADSTARAFSLKDGREVWAENLTPDAVEEAQFGGGLAFNEGRVYATTGYGDVLALDAATGDVLWRTATRDVLRSAPMVYGGRVYAMGITGQLLALDAADGRVLWTHSGLSESSAILGGSVPVISGDVVLAPYNSGELYAVRVQNGRTVWSQSLAGVASRGAAPAMSDIKASPAVDAMNVYAISQGGRLAAVDIRTGSVVWDADIAGIDSPVLAGDVLFVLAEQQTLIALDKGTGTVRRTQELPAFADDDSSGLALRWAGPGLAGGQLWVVNNAGQLHGYNAETLALQTEKELGNSITLPPVALQNTLLVLRDDGTLLALR